MNEKYSNLILSHTEALQLILKVGHLAHGHSIHLESLLRVLIHV